uniref:Cytochrome P450 724B1 n=1 Tax=Kalanchoe fedtschenkoi TaxID=63787 RepID=A0A7N0T7X2_KALFE
MASGALLIGSALVAVVACFLLLRAKRRIPRKAPPGSMGWPLIGETLPFLAPHQSNSVGSFIQSRIHRYGKVFSSHLFGWPTVISCDLELNMFILHNEEKLFLTNYPKAMHEILGKLSLLIVTGEIHRKLRSVVVTFSNSHKSAPGFLRCVERLSTEVMDKWESARQLDFCKEAKMFAFNVTAKTLLSLTPEEAASTGILQDFLTFMEGFVSLPLYLPGTSYAKAVKARGRLGMKMGKIISERRRNPREKADNEGDFLDIILSKEDFNDEEIVSVALDILLGGFETTATLLALVLYFLANSPAALYELRREHQKIQKEKLAAGEKDLTSDDYKKMNFTLKVMNEAMRCGNIVKYLHRRALQDIEFKGYFIPAGWQVFPVFTATHCDSSLHKNPFEFDPWRWTDEATGRKVTPFGGGIRLCPGAALALVEIAFFLHHLVLRFSWKVKGHDCPLAHPYIEFAKGLPLEIQPLKSEE